VLLEQMSGHTAGKWWVHAPNVPLWDCHPCLGAFTFAYLHLHTVPLTPSKWSTGA